MNNKMQTTHAAADHSFSVAESLRALRATGWKGFEGLVATLLTGLTGHRLLLAGSGLQSGLDAKTSCKSDVQIAIECKRYQEETPLSQRELLGEIDAAVTAHPQLDCWILAATRQITVQEESTLEAGCKARGIEYLSLGCATLPNVGLLDALCANQAASALEYLKAAGADDTRIEAFEQATQYIASRSETAVRVEELRRHLTVASLGFSIFRDKLNHRLRDDLADATRCQKRFRCPLSSHALLEGLTAVPRPSRSAQLNQLWDNANSSSDPRAVVILGEEGDGKSWVVADWITDLIETPDAPAIFFIAAREPTSSIRETLSSHACDYASIKSAPDAQRLLDRWLRNVRHRRAVIVFDGLNERLDRTLWSDLVADALQEYGTSVFLVLTCRQQTWQTTYQPVMLHTPAELPIGPFDDQEFVQALSGLPAESKSALIGLGTLVRRPRYFHCACEHALKLGSTHELSIPLLYYLDWQHRHSRRPLLSLNTDDFERGLMELARNQYETIHASRQLLSADPLRDHAFLQHLEELSSSGVLRRIGPLHRWHVEEPFLALGLGMYLASVLEETLGSIDVRCERASAMLGDTSSWDLTGDVMQQALLHALHTTPTFSVETQVALFTVWTQCLNALDQAARVLPQLAVLAPRLVFGFADRASRTRSSDHLIETAILEALIRVLRHPAHQELATEWLCRWAGAVHEFGESGLDDDAPEIHRYVDVDRLCSGDARVLPSSGVALHREPNRVDIRLGRLALAVLSACDRRTYWQALMTAISANEAMGGSRSNVLAWILRSSAQPLDDLADATVTRLLGDHELVSDRAARRLLTFLGSPALMHRLTEIPPDPSPQRRPFQDEYDADPCSCFFIAPPRRTFLGCLSRRDVPYHINAGRAKSLAADRDVEFPDSFADQVRRHARTVDVSRLRLRMETDSEDLKWCDIEPLLCRIDPNLFADIIRQFARTATTRQGLALRQLSWSVEEYADLLGPDEVAALRAAWEHHSATYQPDSRDAQFVEAMLALAILPHLAANAQFEFLLERPRTSLELVSMEDTLKPLALEDQTRWLVPTAAGDTRSVRVALWFLRVQPELNRNLAIMLIKEAIRSEDSVTRGFSLALLQRIERAAWSGINELDTWTDSSNACGIERLYGTSMVMQTTMPSVESLARCSKAHMGAALASLDKSRADHWAACYASLLVRAIRHLATNAPAIPAHPAIDITAGDKRHPWLHLSVRKPRASNLRIVSPMFTWGGREKGDAEAFASAFNHDDQSEPSNDALDAALGAAAMQGDWLFAGHLPDGAIAHIVQAYPSFIEEFEEVLAQAEAGRRIERIQPVVEAMTAWGLRSGFAAAERWLDSLDKASSLVNYKDTLTDLSCHKAALLAAPASPSIETRWRAELNDARSDYELYQIIYTLDSNGHRQWLRGEAEAHLESGSPRGRSLCISILAALADDAPSFNELLPTLSASPSSWYSDFLDLAQLYKSRGEDYRYWLRQAVSHDDAAVRVRAARLALHIEDHRASLIRAQLFDEEALTEASKLRLHRLHPLYEERSRSEWAKNLNERLFGTKQLDHEVAPWLPVPKELQRQ